MLTLLGIDNLQKLDIAIVCKQCEPSGELRTLWRDRARGTDSICQFFENFRGYGHPIYCATTWIKTEPDILLHCKVSDMEVRRYHPWEIPEIKYSDLPARYRRAEQLACLAVQDTYFPAALRCLRQNFERVESLVDSMIIYAGTIRQQIYSLQSRHVGPDPLDEIPF